MSTTAASNRPGMPQSTDSVHLAQRREDIRNIPVTPAFGLENKITHAGIKPDAKVKDYFGAARSLQGNIISATFTIPHVLHKKGKSEWQTDHRFYRSGHLDCLSYLSAGHAAPEHTIIAWTGEITESDNDTNGTSSPPSYTSIASDGQSARGDDAANTDKVVFISTEAQRALETDLYQRSEQRIFPVWLCEEANGRKEKENGGGIELKDQSRWREYAEHDIYPLFHYKQREPTAGGDEKYRWNDYHRANAAFADKICATYQPGDVVLVHDYYLMLVPKMVREKLPDAHIVFMLQTPFPTSEFVRCLHRRQELLEGMLGADVVVFQAHIYAEHFANSCARILDASIDESHIIITDGGGGGRHVQLAHIPTGINIDQILQRAFTPAVDEQCRLMSETFAGKKIILGHDPMNSLSGLDKKLQAFARFLKDWPSWREKVVLLQMISPATLEVGGGTEEADFAAQVNVLVSSINSRYGSLGHTPVQLSPLSPVQDEYFALLRQCDLALVTSVREGISTTALEYAICQRERHGTLILSEFSGTASALDRAVVINPWHTSTVAEEIHDALTASSGRREIRHGALLEQIQEMGVERWARKLFDRIEAIPRG